jgi:hypothetical protein
MKLMYVILVCVRYQLVLKYQRSELIMYEY